MSANIYRCQLNQLIRVYPGTGSRLTNCSRKVSRVDPEPQLVARLGSGANFVLMCVYETNAGKL